MLASAQAVTRVYATEFDPSTLVCHSPGIGSLGRTLLGRWRPRNFASEKVVAALILARVVMHDETLFLETDWDTHLHLFLGG